MREDLTDGDRNTVEAIFEETLHQMFLSALVDAWDPVGDDGATHQIVNDMIAHLRKNGLDIVDKAKNNLILSTASELIRSLHERESSGLLYDAPTLRWVDALAELVDVDSKFGAKKTVNTKPALTPGVKVSVIGGVYTGRVGRVVRSDDFIAVIRIKGREFNDSIPLRYLKVEETQIIMPTAPPGGYRETGRTVKLQEEEAEHAPATVSAVSAPAPPLPLTHIYLLHHYDPDARHGTSVPFTSLDLAIAHASHRYNDYSDWERVADLMRRKVYATGAKITQEDENIWWPTMCAADSLTLRELGSEHPYIVRVELNPSLRSSRSYK